MAFGKQALGSPLVLKEIRLLSNQLLILSSGVSCQVVNHRTVCLVSIHFDFGKGIVYVRYPLKTHFWDMESRLLIAER